MAAPIVFVSHFHVRAGHLDALLSAIDAEIVVTGAVNLELGLDTKTTNGLIIEGTRPGA